MTHIFMKRIDEPLDIVWHEKVDTYFNNLAANDYSVSLYISNMNLRVSAARYKALRLESEKVAGNRRTYLFYDIFYNNDNKMSLYGGLISLHNVDAQRKTVKLSFVINSDLHSHIVGIITHIIADAANLLSHIQFIEIETEFDDNNYDYKLNNLLHQIGFINVSQDSNVLVIDIESFLKNETPRSPSKNSNGSGSGNVSLGSDVSHPKLVCKYFKVNECKWGSRCRFSHDIPVSSTASPSPKERATLPDSPEAKIDQSNTNIISKMSAYLLQFLNNASGEWLSYLKYFGVDAKSRNVSFISDEIIKKIQGLRDAQQLAVIDDVYSTGIDIFKPNSREICSEKLELLLFWNKELLLQFERQMLDSKYQMEVEKHVKLTNFLSERLNLLFARRSPIAYSVGPMTYPVNAATNVPNSYPPPIYAGYVDLATLPSGSPTYYGPNVGVNNALLPGFIPSGNASFISQLPPAAASMPIAYIPSGDTPRYNEQVFAEDSSDKVKNTENRREWTGKRHKKKPGRRQYPVEGNAAAAAAPLATAQRLNFSQVLQAAESQTQPSHKT